MFNYEKRLEFPVNIKTPNAQLAQVIISHLEPRCDICRRDIQCRTGRVWDC